MAYYGYYQSAYPYWGQQSYANGNQFYNSQFIAPPVPTYTPQPSWTGQDYYSAHYRLANGGSYMDDSDVGMFDYVWSRLKGFVGANAVGRDEARHWHRRVYGGMVDITTLLPSDLGAAAGYEAFRLFNYHRGIYRQPLMDDREREEEALAGLAIAEATKLWSYCQRPSDKYGRRETCEVSAATAERLLRHTRRRDSYNSDYGNSYASSPFEDYSPEGSEYDFDDDYHRRGHRRRRRRSSASYGTMIPGGVGSSGYLGAAGAMPVTPYMGGGGASVGYPSAGVSPGYATAPTYATALPGTSPYTPGYGGGYAGGVGVGVGAGAYGAGAYGAGGAAAAYGTPGLAPGLVVPQRSRASSFSYPGSNAYPVAPGYQY